MTFLAEESEYLGFLPNQNVEYMQDFVTDAIF